MKIVKLESVKMNEQELEVKAHGKAIKVIGGHKAQITRASVCLDKVVHDGTVAPGDVATVKAAKSMVEKQMAKIESQVDDLLGNDNFSEASLTEITDYLLARGNLCERVGSILDEVTSTSKIGDTTVLDASGIGNALSESLREVQLRQPLNSADLPVFNGEISEFIPFYETFNFLVHENEAYPDSMKATYLKRCIPEKCSNGKQNPAYDLLKHIVPTNNNYKLMREKLEGRFKLGYVNRATYLSNLRKLGTWRSCTTGLEVRKLYDYITENLDLLELAGGNSVNESDILLYDVLSLIPKFMVNSFLELNDEDRTLDRLLKLIDVSVGRMLERDVLVPKTKPVHVKSGNTNNNTHYQRRHYEQPYNALHISDDNKCLLCGGDHSALTCSVGSLDDRLKKAWELKLCHNCANTGHYSSQCSYSRNCDCGKGKAHCRSLCFRGEKPSTPAQSGRGRGSNSQRGGRGRSQPRGRGSGNGPQAPGRDHNAVAVSPDTVDRAYNAVADTECFFEVGCGYIQSATPGNYAKCRFVFDTASNASYGLQSSVHGVVYETVGHRDAAVDSFAGGSVNAKNVDVVKLVVFDTKDFYEPTEFCITVIPNICRDVPTWQLTSHQQQSIRDYELSDPTQISGQPQKIDILIGLDNYWKFMHRRTDDPGFGPMLRSSKLGWILSGQRDFANPRLLTKVSRNQLTMSVQTLFTNMEVLPDMLEKLDSHSVVFTTKPPQSEEEEYCSLFSDLETFGIKPDQEISPVLEQFNNDIRFNEVTKRYSVRLPFIPHLKSKLKDNYNSCKTRLDALFQSKIRNPKHSEFAKKYYDIISEQESLGIIERVTDISGSAGGGNVTYIPHHGVLQDKLRVVYDASDAPRDSVSLNDCLSPGPSLTNELIEMLMRFRTHDVVVSGDITKAFLMLEVGEADRDHLRFLWYDQDGNLIVYRFTRVPFGLRCSSFLLNATLRYHMQQECVKADNPDLLQRLSKAHYVDDWLVGANTPEEALLMKDWLTQFLESIGMKLHKFNCNSEVVRQNLAVDCPDIGSILGLSWDVTSDEVSIKVEKALKKMRDESTKCELYSAPPRIFDPLGFCQPFIFNAKLLFQEVCKAKIKWKGKLPPEIGEKFENWKSQICKLSAITIPRQVVIPGYNDVELHGFGDASKVGYCACVYIVSTKGSQKVSNLVVSKTRVSPVKEMSIPRLELTASFLLARLMALVIKFHDHMTFNNIVYYSDSTTVLHWVHSNHKQWNIYVANRVRDINLLSSPDSWKYVRTDQNPADLGSRGLDADELVGNDFWFHGPSFLVSGRAEDVHDPDPDISHPTADSLSERRKIVTVAVDGERFGEKILPPGKDGSPRSLTDFSDIDKVLNVTSYLYRFIRLKVGEERFARWLGYQPDTCPRKIAEERWIRSVQAEHFQKEVDFCRDHPKVIPSGMKVVSSKVQQLGLFLDGHGVLRVNTRLHHADILESAKEPMLLPKGDHLTALMVWRAHRRLKHAGVAQTLAEIRQAYWIPQGRQAIRNLLRQCVKCRMILAKPYPVLSAPDLPEFRVNRVDVFQSAGVDFAGPLYMKASEAEKIKGRKEKKKKGVPKEKLNILPERMVYLVIFTCAVSRNVHAELLDGMSVEDLMHGIRRFVTKYGPPSLFYSDNAKQFQCVSRELKHVLNHPKLHKYLHDCEVTWEFYVQKAPWMGGFIERVVGLFKSAVKRVVGRALLDYKEFLTLTYEVTAVLNSRPISYVYDTVGEEEPITPSKLFCGKNITLFPPMYETRLDRRDPEICKKRLKYLDKVLTHFWNRFTSQYLSSLSERHLSRNLPKDGRQPKVGEVVLIKNDLLPRGRWKIAQVVKVTPGADGVIRRVELQPPYLNLTPDTKRNKPSEIINRPPRLLVPLECEVDTVVDNTVDQEDNE